MRHWVDCIEELGPPRFYNANRFEMFLQSFKQIHNASKINRKNIERDCLAAFVSDLATKPTLSLTPVCSASSAPTEFASRGSPSKEL
jgi:hypothetical protein